MGILDQKIVDRLRADLQAERRALLDLRGDAESSWEDLSPPVREAEEAAARDNLRRGVAQLDRIGRERLRRIDAALLKISQERYGLCEDCGRPIAVKRLHALPEARRCMRCASREESAAAAAAPPHEEGERDREAETAIVQALEEDGTVDTDEIDIRCVDGEVHIDGVLPSERQRQAVHDIVESVLGFREIADDTTVDRLPWERRERDPAPEREKTAAEVEMEGEDEEIDARTSLETGEPMTPPDHLVPETD